MGAESYLVIGGSGFLGRHIVEALLARGDKNVSVFDVVQRYSDVTFYSGDITNEEQVSDAVQKSGATCIIHTASPATAGNPNPELFYKVNVLGTKNLLAVAAAHRVPKFVFTSSAGNVYNGTDLIDADERMPVPETRDEYNKTKAEAEAMVLAANGRDGLHTVAIRPAGIFGPGDRQLTPNLVRVIENKQTRIQIGDNNTLFEWTYVTNVAKAHLLAADKLFDPPLSPSTLYTKTLPSINLTVGDYKIPTSEARPPGPTLKLTPEAEKRYFAFQEDAPQQRVSIRSKFDPLSEDALELEDPFPLQVAGQAFFITNGEPLYFWDFMRAMWKELGHENESWHIKIPSGMGLMLGTASEWYSWLIGKEPGFTRGRIYYVTTHRWFNIEKARRVLGYEPDVGIEEGIKRTVAWWKAEHGKA